MPLWAALLVGGCLLARPKMKAREAPAEVLLHEAEAITKDAGVATNTVEEDGTR